MIAVAALAALLSAATPEDRFVSDLLRKMEATGRQAPTVDPALTKAAAALAEKAVAENVRAATRPDNILRAMSEAGAFDPSPRIISTVGETFDSVAGSVLARKDLGDAPVSHMGVASVRHKEDVALIVVLAERKAHIRPFPRESRQQTIRADLCGQLGPGFSAPQVLVTLPQGRVVEPFRGTKSNFCAPLTLNGFGTYTVEVLATSARGPQVVALFQTRLGAHGAAEEDDAATADPAAQPALPEAIRRVVDRINLMRGKEGRKPLRWNARVAAAAAEYCERMAKDRFFSHTAPAGDDLKARLKRAGVSYVVAGENLGIAATVMQAHVGIERSPGHRQNLLNPNFDTIGIGAVPTVQNGIPQFVMTQIFLKASP